MAGGCGMNVRFIDTSIMANLLKIPHKSQNHDKIKREFIKAINTGDTLILPISTIIETGNHIAHIEKTRQRI
jgi:predicted nucleic acid-binding protein